MNAAFKYLSLTLPIIMATTILHANKPSSGEGMEVCKDSSIITNQFPLYPNPLIYCRVIQNLLIEKTASPADIVKCIREKDIDIAGIGRPDTNPLHIAASKGWVECLDVLIQALKNPAQDIDSRDETQQTALIIAAYHGHTSILEKLLAARANPDLQDRGGDTALMLAARGGDLGMIRVLITARASLNLQDFCGDTALIWAAFCERLSAVEALIAAKADLDLKNSREKTALRVALDQENLPICQALINAGANLGTPSDMERIKSLLDRNNLKSEGSSHI
jgi:ankyrin repeat protein